MSSLGVNLICSLHTASHILHLHCRCSFPVLNGATSYEEGVGYAPDVNIPFFLLYASCLMGEYGLDLPEPEWFPHSVGYTPHKVLGHLYRIYSRGKRMLTFHIEIFYIKFPLSHWLFSYFRVGTFPSGSIHVHGYHDVTTFRPFT
jgi:hypothetical protein